MVLWFGEVSREIPSQATLARWWVDLNRWIWPDDLPIGGDPNGKMRHHESNVNGAMAVIETMLNEEGRAIVDELWKTMIAEGRIN